jgi:hypothetical protein
MRLASVIVWLIALSSARSAVACSCVQVSAAEYFRRSPDVFTAQVVSVQAAVIPLDSETRPGKHITLRVVATLKGGKTVGQTEVRDTYDDTGLCGVPAKVGDEVLVYASPSFPREFGRCKTRLGDKMAADLEELKGICVAKPSSKGP